MHLFESFLVVDASVQECFKTWVDCVAAWDANAHFPDFKIDSKSLLDLLKEGPLDWDIAANSTDNHKVLWWRRQNSLLDASGVIHFQSLPNEGQTLVTMTLSIHNPLKGVAGFRFESSLSLSLQRALKQFKRIVASHQLQAHRKEVSYATV